MLNGLGLSDPCRGVSRRFNGNFPNGWLFRLVRILAVRGICLTTVITAIAVLVLVLRAFCLFGSFRLIGIQNPEIVFSVLPISFGRNMFTGGSGIAGHRLILIEDLLGIVGVVLTAGYILWMLQQAFYGPVKEEYNGIKDADALEKVYMFALIAVIMLVGIYPAVLTDVIQLGILPITSLIGG